MFELKPREIIVDGNCGESVVGVILENGYGAMSFIFVEYRWVKEQKVVVEVAINNEVAKA